MYSKGALALLEQYGGDSSDEEVPGSRASTKRLHRDDSDEESAKEKLHKRLPVPNFTIENPESVSDEPEQHEGRIRSFAHERGNWATYVYISYYNNEGLETLISSIKSTLMRENIDLKCFDNFHLSLTRTVILKYHWIDSFVNTLKDNLANFTRFIIMLDSLEIYCNEEKTRTFIGLHVKTGYNSLLKLVHCLDACLSEFKLPKFYDNPSFHISIGWCLGDCTEQLRALLATLNNELEQIITEYPQEYWYIYVQQIMCKTGNKQFQFELK